MSLIILKNTDSQPPNKFGNDFVNTITIKKIRRLRCTVYPSTVWMGIV